MSFDEKMFDVSVRSLVSSDKGNASNFKLIGYSFFGKYFIRFRKNLLDVWANTLVAFIAFFSPHYFGLSCCFSVL